MKDRTTWVSRRLPFLLLLALAAAVQAEDYTYTTNGGTITITGYIGPGGAVAIPDTLNGLPVTRIGDSAFLNCELLDHVTIPDSVTGIGDYVFRSCVSLTNVTMGTNVTSIGAWAFFDCGSLVTVTIPDSATSIGLRAFSGCTSLTSITIPNSVTSSIGNSTFFGCGALASITMGTNVASIGEWAFYNCGSLVTVTIPHSATSIGVCAFYDCTSLTNVIIGNGVASLGIQSFWHCTDLASVTIGSGVTNIGMSAFYECYSLSSVTIPDSVTIIGDSVLQSCISLTNVTIGTNVTSIGDRAFAGCPLTNVSIPDSVTRIGNGVFHSCSVLTSVTIGTNVTSIGYEAFWDCQSLTNVTIPDNVTSIGDRLFGHCTSLTNVTIGISVTNIGERAFYDCRVLTNVRIPASVTSLEAEAFRECGDLTGVCFFGNAPSAPINGVFEYADPTVYYRPGATGWPTVPTLWAGRPTALWTGEMDVQGNSTSITNGDITPSLADHTHFGPALAGGETVVRTFTVTCTGDWTLNLTGSPPVAVSGIHTAEFVVTAQPGTSVAIGSSTTFQVTFSPAGGGTRSATLSITNDDGDENPYIFAIQGEGTGKIIGLSGNLAFENVTTGTTATATLTITNSGNVTLTVTDITYPAGFSGAWSGTIAAGHATNVTVTFAPVALTTYSGTVTVNSDKTSGGSTISASGTGTAKIIGLSGNLAFGNMTTGTTAAATLTITNSGNAALTVTDITYPAGFSGAWSGTIAAGHATNVTVTFAPVALTTYSGMVTVNSDKTSGGNTISASGTGTAKIIGLSGNLAFGSVMIGQPATATLTITNSGNLTLTVTDITYPAGFSGAWGGTLAAGRATNVTVTFAPVALTTYSGTVTVNSDATSGGNTISASGTGTAKIIGLSGNLAFGNMTTGMTATATLTITNSGNLTLTVTGIAYPPGFSGAWSGPIAAGHATNVTVTFAPVALTTYSGTVTVNSDKTSGADTISISGTGMPVPTRIIGLGGDLAFGNIATGTAAMATLTITNSGNATLTVTDITYPPGFSGAWSGTISAALSQDVLVFFSPLAVTTYTGTVVVNSDKTLGGDAMSASGTGTAVSDAPLGEGTDANPYRISELRHLLWMSENAGSSESKYYVVQNDIDALATRYWYGGAGLAPIGAQGAPFMGIFDGNRKVISNLNINRPGQNNVGLVGYLGYNGSIAMVRNLGLAGGSVTGSNYVGSLVGCNDHGRVTACYGTVAVTATGDTVGGLVGLHCGNWMTNCYAAGAVTGRGLYTGGLVGYNYFGRLVNCYASGSVTGNVSVGGLIGETNVGGGGGTTYNGTVSRCYATGPVAGNSDVGGLVGKSDNLGTVTESYWDTETSGTITSSAGTGKTTVQMKQQATFAGWDFAATWRISENETYPLLRALQVTIISQSAFGGTLPSLGTNWFGCNSLLTAVVTNSPVVDDKTQYVCRGWTGTGSIPESGTTTSTPVFSITTNSTIAWLWTTSYWLNTEAGSHGSVNISNGWQQSGASVLITPAAAPYYHFVNWTGDAAGDDNPLDLVMDAPKSVTANFAQNMTAGSPVPVPEEWLAQYGLTNFEEDVNADSDHDGQFTWEEYLAAMTDPTNPASFFHTQVGHGSLLISWPSASGRLYNVETTLNAPGYNWTLTEWTNQPATPPMNTVTNPPGAMTNALQFFRTRARME